MKTGHIDILVKIQMNWLYTIIIFAGVLLLYIHIIEQWRKSEQLEIYEMDYVNPQHLSEICRIKQPILFEKNDLLQNPITFTDDTDVLLKDTIDYSKPEPVDTFSLSYSAARTLFQTDETARYFMESESVCTENAIVCDQVDGYLKPVSTIYSKHELLAGSKKVMMPLKYHTCDRKFITVLNGRVRIMMTPWKSEKLLNPIHDYENYEFRSLYNPWKMTDGRLKFLEFDINPGFILYIPPYWWHSIQLVDPDTTAILSQYNSLQNLLANGKHIGLYYLQQTNITEKPTRTLEIPIGKQSNVSDDPPLDQPNTDTDTNNNPLSILQEGNHGTDIV